MNSRANKYYIEIIYDTGDSFNHYTDKVSLVHELSWNNLDIATENLKRLEAHYKLYTVNQQFARFDYSEEQIEQIKQAAKQADWYNPKYESEYSMFMYDDDGNKVGVSTFWTGYFETLKSAEIKINETKNELIFRP